ncbi:hypothetical protein PYW07_005176 [Mythimna separata]|uniref:COX assembly mitochondrial protein n=1 Tax=Mythimna separata TaxID=271217 RepID=A0AAD7YDW8_MYTSE|nr:hypothetical protein PYW07_005176 [Mythimna separata]
MPDKSVLPNKLSEGPHGLGDPDDRSLRRVEKDVLIPKLIRDKAKKEKCFKEVADFESCCKESSLLMVVKCRNQNAVLKECLGDWYKNEEFKNQCTEEYLAQRREYRTTGIRKPIKRA